MDNLTFKIFEKIENLAPVEAPGPRSEKNQFGSPTDQSTRHLTFNYLIHQYTQTNTGSSVSVMLGSLIE